MPNYTLNDLAKLSSLELAMLVIEQQALLNEAHKVIKDSIITLEEVKKELLR